ncbi:MAG: flagellar biosynthetic protein FliR [Verrucomicrobiota bacterium]|jgi:flagellar biosynthetic protein FliR
MITIRIEDIYPGMLIFLRASGLFLVMPVFSGQMIPAPVRIGIAAMIAYLLAPIFGDFGGLPGHWFVFVLEVIHEVLAGLLLGFAVRFLLYALEMAGEIIAVQIGLSLSSNIDPVTRNTATPPNTMLMSFGTVLFLVTGAYQFCLVAFARSFEIFPPSAIFDPQSINTVIATSGRVFLLATQIAAPLLAISFLVNMCFSVLGRAAPSLNVFLLSFPVQILAGLTVFAMTLGLTFQYIMRDMQQLPETMLRFLR